MWKIFMRNSSSSSEGLLDNKYCLYLKKTPHSGSEERCLRHAVGRDHCNKSELWSFSVHLDMMNWSAHENFRHLRRSSRSTVQAIVQAVCKELVDLSGQGEEFCVASVLLILSFQRNSKLQPVEEADLDRFSKSKFGFDFLLCKYS